MKTPGFLALLRQRASEAGLSVPQGIADSLATYFELLAHWNQKVNLVGFSLEEPSAAAIDRLFIEPLLAARIVRQPVQAMIDIGSGGGSPGFPMLLALAPSRTLLVEARSRKSVFLKEVARSLGLTERVEVLTARFEELALEPTLSEAFSLLTVRAVRIAAPEISKLAALLGHGGQMCLFQGREAPVSWSIPGLGLEKSVPLASSDRSIVTLLTRT